MKSICCVEGSMGLGNRGCQSGGWIHILESRSETAHLPEWSSCSFKLASDSNESCSTPLIMLIPCYILVAALITSCYTAKMFFQSFMLDFSGNDFNVSPLSKNTSPLIAAAMTILILDVLLKIWVGTNLLSGILLFIPWGVKTLPAGLVIAGVLSATASVGSKQFALVRFSATRWGFDQMYARTLVNLVLDWGRITWSAGDRGLFYVNNLRAH